VIGETAVLILCGVTMGLGGAWALTRYIRSMLFGVTELDTTTFAFTPVLLATIVMIAAFGPARRAVNPSAMRGVASVHH